MNDILIIVFAAVFVKTILKLLYLSYKKAKIIMEEESKTIENETTGMEEVMEQPSIRSEGSGASY
jgi:hypothetical protein